MSYFAFGSISYNKIFDTNTQNEMAWKILHRGISHTLLVLLAPNIPQKIVNEMLDKQETNIKADFRFLLVASPICDTSDLLISPSYFGENDLKSVFKNLSLLDKWICDMFKYDGAVRVSLYLTEGYDDVFKKIKTSTKPQ